MRHDPNALMIFAAGFGTRMGALTADRPKPMVKVAGKPLIDHCLKQAEGVNNIVVNTHYLAHVLEDHLAGRDVTLVNEAPKILETGGGLKNAAPLLGKGPCFTLNSDAVWKGENPLRVLANTWDPEKMDALLLLLPKAQALGHKGEGDFLLNANGQITRGAGLVYSGAQIIRPELAVAHPAEAFSLNVIWDKIAQTERLYGVVYAGQWCDVGSPEGITTAEAMLRYV